ncbi:MAG: B12-binding domain-containing radical SAM protein, partial [Chitinophagaceae bacterium]
FLPGLAFPVLAAMTPPGWEVDLCLEVIEEIPFDTDADIIGIGAMVQAVLRAKEIAIAFKKLGKTVIMGGYMPSMIPDFVKDVCDSIVIGDAEISYPLLLQDYLDGRLKKIYHFPISELKDIPLPKYELLVNKPIGFMLPVQAGRGCPHTCSYCSIYCLYKQKYLTRPLNEVLRDIKRVKELGYKSFFLLDDNLIGNPRFFEELCIAIKPLKMIWATQCSIMLAKNPRLLRLAELSGCRILSIGIESITQESLDKQNKKWVHAEEHKETLSKILEVGIMPATEMIVGMDGDTEESIRETASFVIKCRIPIPKFYVLTPMPGTDLYEQYKNEGRLLHEDYSRYTATNTVFRPTKISPEKLEEMYWWLYRKVYSIPNIIRRTLWHRNFWKHPLSFLFAFFVNLSYQRFIKRGDAPNIL